MSLIPFEKLAVPKRLDRLGPLCGPHCGIKDGVTGHCDGCHRIKSQIDDAMNAHLNGYGYIGRIEV